jgi:hypothetical protein
MFVVPLYTPVVRSFPFSRNVEQAALKVIKTIIYKVHV